MKTVRPTGDPHVRTRNRRIMLTVADSRQSSRVAQRLEDRFAIDRPDAMVQHPSNSPLRHRRK